MRYAWQRKDGRWLVLIDSDHHYYTDNLQQASITPQVLPWEIRRLVTPVQISISIVKEVKHG